MDPFEAHTHSFIVKIWREQASTIANHATWRGYIRHVPDGKQRYLQDLDDIARFIKPYLREMQVELAIHERVRWRLAEWARRLTGRKRL